MDILSIIKGVAEKVVFQTGKIVSVFPPAEEVHEDPVLQRYNALRTLYLKYGAPWEDVNIFGIRDEMGQEKDLFNDFIGVAYDAGKVKFYVGTCDPGAYWTKVGGYNPDKKGAAHICLGYHRDTYQVGYHRTQEALVQTGAPIRIWRDKNRNYIQDGSEVVESGFYAVNIHTTTHKPPVIGQWSAGCQVIQKPDDLAELLTIVKSSEKYLKKGVRAKFSYFLFSMDQLHHLIT